MTDEVAALVLRDSYAQTQGLSVAVASSRCCWTSTPA